MDNPGVSFSWEACCASSVHHTDLVNKGTENTGIELLVERAKQLQGQTYNALYLELFERVMASEVQGCKQPLLTLWDVISLKSI